MLHHAVQVESRCQPRKPYPAPSKGALPLKALPQIKSGFAPCSLQDLAAVLPDGAPKLEAPQAQTATVSSPQRLNTRILNPDMDR